MLIEFASAQVRAARAYQKIKGALAVSLCRLFYMIISMVFLFMQVSIFGFEAIFFLCIVHFTCPVPLRCLDVSGMICILCSRLSPSENDKIQDGRIALDPRYFHQVGMTTESLDFLYRCIFDLAPSQKNHTCEWQ